MKKNQKGFSLIELLIVVAIILIIAAIAIPNLLRAKIAANQASAVGSLRTITSAEETFNSTYSDGFTTTLGQLGSITAGAAASCANAGLIDEVLSNNGVGNVSTKSGYTFTFTPGTIAALTSGIPAACGGTSGFTGFSVSAVPLTASTGTASYCVDESAVVRVDGLGGAMAGVCSVLAFPPLQ
jgi:type IV pilus assembly protein PilA